MEPRRRDSATSPWAQPVRRDWKEAHIRSDGDPRETIEMVKIEIRPNGPYVVTGPIELTGPDGNPVELEPGKQRVFLCRCGMSAEKPFCDGSHNKNAWKAGDAEV